MHRIYILNLITKCYLDLVCKGKIGHACCPFLFNFKIKSCLNSEVGQRYKVTYSTRVSEKEIFIIRVELIFLGIPEHSRKQFSVNQNTQVDI